MAFATPVAGTVAYSASGGTSVSPAYPPSILTTDVVVLFVGQKPSTANGGTVTTPTGWTLQDSLTAAGGYGTTLGADTGNTNLFAYTWDAPVAGQTGNLAVTLGTNGVAWAFMVRIPSGGEAHSYGSADGSQTTAPTAGTPFTVALTNGATATDFQAGDIAIWAMCIPTDVTTPSQFSAQSVTATGVTFGTAVELREPDSTTGNDIGGYSAYAVATSGSSTTAPSVTVTAAGTTTNVRGPVVMLRLRDLSQGLFPSFYTNTNTFYTPTITQTSPTQTLTPDLYTNTNTFYTPDVTQTGGGQNLDPALYTNTNTFYSATVTTTYALTAARYDNTNTFYSATVTTTRTLAPALYTNTNTFYSPVVSTGANNLVPDLYTNTNTFYSATATAAYTLAPALYTNTNTFYSATVTPGTETLLPSLYTNTNAFYSPTVIQGAGNQNLLPDLYTNTNAFYAATAAATNTLYLGPYVDDGYVDPWYIGLALQNVSQFYTPTLVPGAVTLTPARYDNTNVFYSPQVIPGEEVLEPPLVPDTNTFYSATVTPGAVNIVLELLVNTNEFYDATVEPGPVTLAPARYNNTNTFYSPLVVVIQFVEPDLYTNTNTFYSATVASKATLRPARFNNQNEFFRPVLAQEQFLLPLLVENVNRFPQARLTYRLAAPLTTNTNSFFSPAVTQNYTLTPARFDNTNTFYSATVVPGTATIAPALYANDNEFFGPTVTTAATVAPIRVDNTNSFFGPTVAQFWGLRPAFFLNVNTIYPATLKRGLPSPNWNPGTIANDDAYTGDLVVNAPAWTNGPTPPAPDFNKDTGAATPNWTPS